jgi:hypothetical protein
MLAGSAVTLTVPSASASPGAAAAAAVAAAAAAQGDRGAEPTEAQTRTPRATHTAKPTQAARQTQAAGVATAVKPATTTRNATPTERPTRPAERTSEPATTTTSTGSPAALVDRTEPQSSLVAGPAPERSLRRAAEPVWRTGWVCDGRARIQDFTGSGWSVGKVTFRDAAGFDRVTLRLERTGPDGGAPASLTAEALPTSTVKEHFPRVQQPSAGGTTVGLRFEDGVRGLLGLRGYRPQGMDLIKQFSAYPGSGGSATMLVTVAGEGCFRLRAPDWAAGASARQAEVHVDIRP